MCQTCDVTEKLTDIHLEAWRTLLMAHAHTIESIEADLAAAELPPLSTYDVLWALHQAPARGLRMYELAREVVISRTWLSRVVDRLEHEGYVRREPCLEDRRGSFVALTDEGVALLRRIWPAYAAGIERHFSRLVTDPAAIATLLGPLCRHGRLGARSER